MKTRFRADVWRLLRRNISKGQLLGYALANIIGLTVILCGILFFRDSRQNNAAGDSFFSDDFVVVSKRVDGVGFEPVSFSEEEIAEIQAQPWARKVGRFTSSQFAANGSVSLGGRGMSSYMFFESVPDEFFDRLPPGWRFDPADGEIPIVLSRDYLALYNFGFAIPQGLPQVSEKIIGAIPLQFVLTGKDQGLPLHMQGRVVGFSSRLNTIAVPQSFMDWANSRLAPGVDSTPSRLILKVDRMQEESMAAWLKDHDIETGGDHSSARRVSAFLSVVSEVVTANGVVISLLAVFILLLSIFLLLQKSREKLRCLMLLGYSPKETARYYEAIVTGANLLITVLATGTAFLLRPLWDAPLKELQLGGSPAWPVLLTAAGYFLLVTAINVAVIRRHLIRIWQD